MHSWGKSYNGEFIAGYNCSLANVFMIVGSIIILLILWGGTLLNRIKKKNKSKNYSAERPINP
jgi:hypothetical protein